jgi:hypothetical protein
VEGIEGREKGRRGNGGEEGMMEGEDEGVEKGRGGEE